MTSVARVCSEESCEKPPKSRGLCDMHYLRLRRSGDMPPLARKSRMCDRQGCEARHFGHGLCKAHYSRARSSGELVLPGDEPCGIRGCEGVSYIRQMCQSHYQKAITYSLDVSQLQILLDSDCAICGAPGRDIDHDHSCCPGVKSCGACVRGMLCNLCNKGLGQFQDDPERLKSAIRYLEKR